MTPALEGSADHKTMQQTRVGGNAQSTCAHVSQPVGTYRKQQQFEEVVPQEGGVFG